MSEEDFALPAATDSIDAVPEQFRSLYKQDGDLFVAKVAAASGYGLDRVDDMRRQIAELGDKHRKSTDRLKAYETEDGNLLDPEEFPAPAVRSAYA